VDVVQVQNTEEGAQVMHGRVRPLQARRAGRADRGWRDRDRGHSPDQHGRRMYRKWRTNRSVRTPPGV
jgi:hypothetical protein